MVIDGDVVPFFSTHQDPKAERAGLKVDLVLECTGAFTNKEKAQARITQDAEVLIARPGRDDVDTTIVHGVINECALKADADCGGPATFPARPTAWPGGQGS